MKLERIAVGIDFSPASMDAAHWVSRTLGQGSEIVLAHVIAFPEPPPIVRGRYPRRELLVGTLRAGADKRLRELSGTFPAGRIRMEIREGEAAGGLAGIAADYQADLLVVGAHGERTGLAEGLGTTAWKVVRAANLPVMLVTRPHDAPPTRILVPIGDDTVAHAALRWAAALSERFGAQVVLLHVTPSGVLSHALAAAADSGTRRAAPASPRSAPAESDPLIDLAVASGVARSRVTSEEAFGDPASEIVAARERLGASLIVIARRAAGGLRRAVFGSVTEHVLRHAGCNVLVVPEPHPGAHARG